MTQDIVYTLGIIIAILLLLIFLRSVLLRRQRLAVVQAATATATTAWQFRPDRGVDVVRPEPAVTDMTVLQPLERTRTPEEQLPLYEAPPPGYDVVPKEGDATVDLERGGPSSVPVEAPPGYVGEGSRAVARTETGERGLFRVDVRRAWSGFGR